MVVDALTTPAILLVGNLEGGMGGQEQLRQRCSVGDDGVICPSEKDILHSETLGAGAVLWSGVSVFSDPEKIVESNADEFANRCLFGIGV